MAVRFIDEVKIKVQAGKGGNGCMSFRRERFIPKGGPDGGDGGRGASIYLEATPQLQTLLDFRYRPEIKADSGRPGEGWQKNGRGGEDVIVPVPLGTIVSSEDGEIQEDLTEPGQRILVARGGKGGLGNIHFKSSTQQAPRIATEGEAGEERRLKLDLKVLADVGIIGLPNAGKSTLLASLSAAHPKIGDYPFTTLYPNLGVIEGEPPVVVADIPGLVQGAHMNVGLGHRFLKHISRTQCLLYLLSFDEKIPLVDALATLEAELEYYDKDLLNRPSLYCVNKSDLLQAESRGPLAEQFEEEWEEFKKAYPESLLISAAEHQNLGELLDAMRMLIGQRQKAVIS